MPDFWKSAGFQLVERGDNGWLKVTPEYLRAYLQRPEIRPIETSCDEEIRLFQDLLNDPLIKIRDARLDGLKDQDASDNYRIVLAFRDHLTKNGTIEATYLSLMRSGAANIPPLFVEQMAHLIARNILNECPDPIRLRAAEIFFREQSVNNDEGRIMLADEEIVSLYEENQKQDGDISLTQLVKEASGENNIHQLDVLNEDNKDLYWQRSDKFDTVIDFRFAQPALDGFARTVESWVEHFLSVKTAVQPLQKIENLAGHWHIGLDREATAILSSLYRGETVPFEASSRIIALFKMNILDERVVIPEYKRQPIFLGLAMNDQKRVRMKPQNLLTNLPLIEMS